MAKIFRNKILLVSILLLGMIIGSLNTSEVKAFVFGSETIASHYFNRASTTLSPANVGDSLDMGTGSITGASLTSSGMTIAGFVKNSTAGLLSGGNTIAIGDIGSLLSAGTGISYNNTTGVITNSAPDQTVSFSGGTNVTIGGTYPSFSITDNSISKTAADGYYYPLSTNPAGYLTLGTLPAYPTQYWQRNSTTLSPATAGDNISTTGSGTLGYLNLTNPDVGIQVNGTSAIIFHNYSDDIHTDNISIGRLAGNITTNTNNNIFIGYKAGYLTSDGNDNIFIGYKSGYSHTRGTDNAVIGWKAGYNLTIGSSNQLIGDAAGFNLTDGAYNTFMGDGTAEGYGAGSNLNTIIGAQAGNSDAMSASGNVFLGALAGNYETGSNKLFIDNQDRTDEATARTSSLVYGIFDATPLNQSIRFNVGSASFGAGNILTTGTLGAGAITGTSFIIGANTISDFTNLKSLAGLSYGTSPQLVKMTAAGTFALDTNTYLTSLSGAVLTTTNQSVAGIKTFSDTTEASNTTTGGTVISGGLAVAKRVYATDLTVTNAISGSVTGSSGSTTGNAAGLSAQYIDWSASSGGTSIANKPTALSSFTNDVPFYKSGDNASFGTLGAGAITGTGLTVSGTSSTISPPTSPLGTITYNAAYLYVNSVPETHTIRIYSYKTINGQKVFSSTYATQTVVSDGTSGHFRIAWSWTAASGVDGYRIFDYDDYNALNFDKYKDQTGVSFTDTNYTVYVKSGTEANYTIPTIGYTNSLTLNGRLISSGGQFNFTSPAYFAGNLLGNYGRFYNQTIVGGTTDEVQLKIQGASTQNANIMELWSKAEATTKKLEFYFNPSGYFIVGTTPNASLIGIADTLRATLGTASVFTGGGLFSNETIAGRQINDKYAALQLFRKDASQTNKIIEVDAGAGMYLDKDYNFFTAGTITGSGGIITKDNSSAPTLSTNGQVQVGLDGSSYRLYFYSNGAQKYINSNGSFEIPGAETVDPISGDQMKTGDFVIGMLDKNVGDTENSIHGVWVKWDSVKKQLVDEISQKLTATGAVGDGTISGVGLNNPFVKQIQNILASLGLNFDNGAVKLNKIEMVDQATGEVYCTWISNGEWQKVKGACGTINSNPQTSESPADTTTSASTPDTTTSIPTPDTPAPAPTPDLESAPPEPILTPETSTSILQTATSSDSEPENQPDSQPQAETNSGNNP